MILSIRKKQVCSFCGKSGDKKQEDPMVDNGKGTAAICGDCIMTALGMYSDPRSKPAKIRKKKTRRKKMTPRAIKEELDKNVVGQENVKKALALALYNHEKRIAHAMRRAPDDVILSKRNQLLIGKTGVGKTHLVKTLAEQCDKPIVCASATALTAAGYVGEDVEDLVQKLFLASGCNLSDTEHGIIYIDEIDKAKCQISSNGPDVGGESVQQGLLKLMEGQFIEVSEDNTPRNKANNLVTLDTSDILFIFSGAFVGLESIIAKRTSKNSIGFGKPYARSSEELLQEVTADDLINFGFIPEFVGRIASWEILHDLSEEHLQQILVEPRDSLVKQYQAMMSEDGIELVFKEKALRMIAQIAHQGRGGARDLERIMEKVLKNAMYDLPSEPAVKKCTITPKTIEGLGYDLRQKEEYCTKV